MLTLLSSDIERADFPAVAKHMNIIIRKSNYLFEPLLVLSQTNKNSHHLLDGQKTCLPRRWVAGQAQRGRSRNIDNLKFRAVYHI